MLSQSLGAYSMNNNVYLKDKYLNYLVFSEIEKDQQAKELFEHIGSWVFSRNDKQEAKFLITKMVCEMFDIEFLADFEYNNQVIEAIENKSGFERIKRHMKLDIQRVYEETQNYLKSINDKTDSIRLYRSLNRNEIEQFEQGYERINSNILSSFTTDAMYHKKEVQISIDVPIENILFYDNLCPMSEFQSNNNAASLGLYAERETIVICKSGGFLIDQLITHNIGMKRRREAEEFFN